MRREKPREFERRRFLKQVAGGAAGAGMAGSLLVGAGLGMAPPETAPQAPSAAQRQGYRLTEHVRTYYAKARL